MRLIHLSLLITAFCISLFPSIAVAADDINLGIVAPVTGAFAPLGYQIVKGAQLAVHDINSKSGINNKKIKLVIQDDGDCNPARAAAASKKLIFRDHVKALIGYPCAGAAMAGAAVAIELKTLMISFATLPILTRPDRPILRMIGRQDHLAEFTANFVQINLKGKKIGAVFPANLPTFNKELQTALKARGIKLARTETYDLNKKTLPKWSHQLDAIIIPGSVAANMKNIFAAKAQLIIPTTMVSSTLANLLKEKNAVVISNPGPDFFDAGSIARRAGFEQPNRSGYAIYAYSAIQLFAALARRSRGDYSGPLLADMARKSATDTAIGKLMFNQRGDIPHWHFAAYGVASGPNVCKSPQCPQYAQCRPCPK